ncbi:D-glycerate dehydrogenase [Aneurinibacillus sp. Ricciae_BoGa-3]|uniref:2-hydroxyacid dehydrogenase n=1 Tax=Aneurinibacillus sp. Ricciae_BoGa-3 TaxID=3022697 RepID=UPI0023421B72|nr:D-glycerate dehydrogenase [Aneurinibacillus sp. Ricciae_BoGa-3]WCK56418.1 D-glycerate dehydrogenase [Aneurinibacillus sp. Ricciae_BoGa-3]
MKPKIYVTRKLPDVIISYLSNECEVRMWDKEDEPVPPEILAEEIEEVDGLLCLLTETIDERLLGKGRNLKVVSNMAVGYNNIDIQAAKSKGVQVTNTPGVLTETTADLTFGLLIATARRFEESINYVKEGKWKTWSPMGLTGQDIFGATLGIIGMGDIGEAVASRAKGFKMNVLYHNRKRKIAAEETLGAAYRELDDLLTESDFVVVLTPYTPQTHDLISYKELALMKPTSILINTSRGGIVNEEALYQALLEKKIYAAGLDVFEQEPVSLTHPLLQLPNVTALPHIGSASVTTRMKMAKLAAFNLLEALQHRTPPNLVVTV